MAQVHHLEPVAGHGQQADEGFAISDGAEKEGHGQPVGAMHVGSANSVVARLSEDGRAGFEQVDRVARRELAEGVEAQLVK